VCWCVVVFGGGVFVFVCGGFCGGGVGGGGRVEFVERDYELTAQQRKEIFQTTNLKFRFPFTPLIVSSIVGLLL